jgi:hypothetical protein
MYSIGNSIFHKNKLIEKLLKLPLVIMLRSIVNLGYVDSLDRLPVQPHVIQSRDWRSIIVQYANCHYIQ